MGNNVEIDVLYRDIVEKLKENAQKASPGNNLVLNVNNQVPEMIAKEVVDLITEKHYIIVNDDV